MVSTRTYFTTFIALIVLTGVSVWVAFLDLDPVTRMLHLPLSLNTIVTLSIAVTQATLVVLYSMHLRYTNQLTKVVAASGFLWLGILFVLTMSDYLSRGWIR